MPAGIMTGALAQRYYTRRITTYFWCLEIVPFEVPHQYFPLSLVARWPATVVTNDIINTGAGREAQECVSGPQSSECGKI